MACPASPVPSQTDKAKPQDVWQAYKEEKPREPITDSRGRKNGTPEGTRTPDLLIRSQSLYPTELPAHTSFPKRPKIISSGKGKSKYFFEKRLKIKGEPISSLYLRGNMIYYNRIMYRQSLAGAGIYCILRSTVFTARVTVSAAALETLRPS